MAAKKIFRIRRAILAAVYDYSSYQDLDTVAAHPRLICEGVSPEELRIEWGNLVEYGLLEPLAGYRGSVCRLPASVRHTMDETGNPPRDARLYGYEAIG